MFEKGRKNKWQNFCAIKITALYFGPWEVYKGSVIGGQSSSGTAINIFLHFCVWLYLLSVFVFRPGEEYMGSIIGGNPILVKTFWDNQYFIAHLSLCFFLFFVFVFKFQLEKLYMGWVIGGKSNYAYLCICLCLCLCFLSLSLYSIWRSCTRAG